MFMLSIHWRVPGPQIRRKPAPARAGQIECEGQALFLAVLFGVRLHRLFRMASSMTCVAAGGVSMVRRFFVVSARVVLRSFLVVTSRMRMVFCSLFMVFCSFL
jgi:hypothetical protein